jgi:hypothetical protein
VPVGAVELDYLIADPALRGRGLGSRMIAAAVEDTWNSYSDAPAVLVAVVAANVASWRALDKAGLKRVAEGPMSLSSISLCCYRQLAETARTTTLRLSPPARSTRVSQSVGSRSVSSIVGGDANVNQPEVAP